MTVPGPSPSTKVRLDPLLTPLQIPEEFSYYERITDTNVIARLQQWKRMTDARLSELQNLVVREGSQLSDREQAEVISTTAPFEGEGFWTSNTSRNISEDILASLPDPTISLIETILTHHVKVLFKSNPHPSLNVDTGRKLPENAGGPMAMQDYYEGQTWKGYPGAPNLVSWCVRNTESVAYERLWHLIIPPVMTLLDDYEASYKLRGIKLVSEMLARAPNDLLRRTGVDQLLFTSLTISLTNLHNPQTPSILRTAIPATVTLVDLSTSPGSQARFDKLCALLGDGIIGNVWIYADQDEESILATLDVLPVIIEALGIGCARYLKGLIHQLTYPLLPSPVDPSRPMQLSSLRALGALIQECAPRMQLWKGTIVSAVAKCWVGIIDASVEDTESREVKDMLKETFSKLTKACPSVLQDEFQKLVALDANMFVKLVEQRQSIELE